VNLEVDRSTKSTPEGAVRPAQGPTKPSSPWKESEGDYQATNGQLTFAPSETTKTITIAVYGDREIEDHETFYLRLTDDLTDALLAEAIGTIENDD
jgi:hypothetical protein